MLPKSCNIICKKKNNQVNNHILTFIHSKDIKIFFSLTKSPTLLFIFITLPLIVLLITCSIFIASITINDCPTLTVSSSLTSSFMILLGIGAFMSFTLSTVVVSS
eukprot:NODE_531_length_7106_cov_0.213929.p6 type:complete len:105 gc:universal NODE_531_length_7106_cov_0.213929:734-1048(+)